MRRSGDLPSKGGDEDKRTGFQHQVVIKPHNLTKETIRTPTAEVPEVLTLACGHLGEEPPVPAEGPVEGLVEGLAEGSSTPDDSLLTITELFDIGYTRDLVLNDILEQLRRGQTHSKQLSLAECRDNNGRLVYR